MSPGPAHAPAAPAEAEGGSLQDAVQQDLYRLEVYREQLTALARQQELLRISLESHARAQRTLEELEKFEGDREVLVPIGAEAYLRASPRSKEKVLLGLGNGIVAELDRPVALERLKERLAHLERSENSLLTQFRKVESEAAQLQAKVQAIYEEVQARAQGAEGAPAARAPAAKGRAGPPRVA